MNITSVVIELPEAVYKQVERTAMGLNRPIPQALIKIVESGLPSLAKVPPKHRPDLEALESLTDDELWQVAESTISEVQQLQLDALLQKQQTTPLTETDQLTLTHLQAESTRLMFRKSYAYVLLKWRGHAIPNPYQHPLP